MMGFNLYDLFHDKRLEVEKFFLKEGINNFYYMWNYGIYNFRRSGSSWSRTKRKSERIYQKLIKSGINEKEAYRIALKS